MPTVVGLVATTRAEYVYVVLKDLASCSRIPLGVIGSWGTRMRPKRKAVFVSAPSPFLARTNTHYPNGHREFDDGIWK